MKNNSHTSTEANTRSHSIIPMATRRTPFPDSQLSPPHPTRKSKPISPPNRRRRRLFISLAFLILLLIASLHATAALLRRSNRLGRRCMPEPARPPLNRADQIKPKIAMVSFSDEKKHEDGKPLPRRSFQGLMEAMGGNKRAYTARMGYDFIDARGVVDPRRPPNWSKIPAVQAYLSRYDWVFWNDADTLVTNPIIQLEDVLLSVIGHADFDTSPDLVVTEDYNGVNSGVFFVRRSEWSKIFLDTWWNQTSFIRFGSTKSGDNAAMKQLIADLSPDEFQAHVRVAPMQCLFNSYIWLPTWKSVIRLISSPSTAWKGVYSDGDFMVHFAGLDDKTRWATSILREIEVNG